MILAIKFQDSPPPLLCKSAWPETLLVRNLETTRLNRFKEKFKYPLNRVSWKVWERTFIQRKIFTDFWKLQRKPCFYINWKLSKKIDCIVLFKTHEKRYSMRFQGGTPPPSEFRGGVYHPWIFSKSLFRRLLTWNRTSMTTDRLVKLERMAMHKKWLASLSDNSVLNAFISSGPRKLNYRRSEEGGYFYFLFFYFAQKFLFLFTAFLWYTINNNSRK